MKKLLIAFLMMVMPLCANAISLHFDSSIVGSAMEKYFPDVNLRASAMKTYEQFVRNGNGISAVQLYAVCGAGGLNTQQSAANKQKCQEFVQYMLNKSTIAKKQVCNKDKGKTGGTEECVKDFADGGPLEFKWGAKVTMRQAILLAKEWARIKKGDKWIVCSDTPRDCDGNDDCMQCVSIEKNNFYEFRFGSLEETNDLQIQKSIVRSVCTMHGTKPDDGTFKIEDLSNVYYAACENTTPQKCTTDISKTFKKFGYTTEYSQNQKRCNVSFNSISDASKLNKYSGLDNFAFCHGIELSQSNTIDGYLEQWVRGQGISVSSFKCDAAPKIYTGDGCKADWSNHDEILTCYINNKPFDFVFDDLNDNLLKKHNAGMQGIMCVANDGAFDGRNCSTLDKAACDALIKTSQNECPKCKSVFWDSKSNLCVLPESRDVSNGKKIAEFAGVTILVVSTTALTVATGGATAGGWAIVANVANAMVVTGAITERAATAVMTFGIYDPFVKRAQECFANNDATCAEEVVTKDLNSMKSYGKNLTAEEAKALDKIFVKLVEMIPDDSKFWDEFFGNPEFFNCDQSGNNCAVIEETQFWQYAQTAGNIMMLAGGILKSISALGSSLSQTKAEIHGVVKRLGKSGLRVADLNSASAGGNIGSWVQRMQNTLPQEVVSRISKNYSTTRAFIDFHKLSVGDEIWIIGDRVFKNANAAKQFAAATAVKTNLYTIPTLIYSANELINEDPTRPLVISRPGTTPEQEDDDAIVDPIEPDDEDPVIDPVVPVPTPVPVVPVPTPEPLPVPAPVVPEPAPAPSPDPVVINPVVVTPVVTTPVVTTPVVTTPEPEKDVTPYVPEKKDHTKTALIAGAAVLGAVGTGVLVGTLVSGKDKKDDANAHANVTSDLDNKLNVLLMNAGAVGFVGANNDEVRIVPLPTTVNSNAPIVGISGKPVVVVEYRNHKFPFYVNASTMSWAPLLGIGENGGWFNVYPPKQGGASGIDFIDDITQWLNQKLNPADVMQFAGQNQSGVQYPAPSTSAYKIINAEFPNGVIQINNGTLTPAQNAIYNSNYSIIKSMFKFAQKWAIFFGTSDDYTLPLCG